MNTTNEEVQAITILEPDQNEINSDEQEKAWDRFIRNTAIFLSSAE